MHILLTGAAGLLGSHTLIHLLSEGHTVLAVDRVPLPAQLAEQLSAAYPDTNANANTKLEDRMRWEQVDLTCVSAVRALLRCEDTTSTVQLPDDDTVSGRMSTIDGDSSIDGTRTYPSGLDRRRIDGVIHLAAIPTPGFIDPLELHNINVTSSYNVLYAACRVGVRRIAQASSVNAVGLAFTPDERTEFDKFPLDEGEGYRPEDEYSVSKQICEVQASSLVRLFPTSRIASLRFHHILPSLADGIASSRHGELWAWSDVSACSRACLQALTSEGWGGHEAFFIASSDLVWDGGVSPESKGDPPGGGQVSALELIEYCFKGKVGYVDRSWWANNPRRGLYDCTKAERLLGWKHEL